MNNPLTQYFRRPALHLTLPSKGAYYPAGAIDMPETGELPVYPMTAIDEITTKTPDALFNGSAVVDLVKSCIPGIKDPWSIPSMDLDAILIAIRAASNGNELEIMSECPSCNNEGKYGVNLIQILSTIKGDDYNKVLEIGDLKIKFRPLSYKEVNKGNLVQFEMQREIAVLEAIEDAQIRQTKSSETIKKLAEMNMAVIALTIDSIILPDQIVTNSDFITEFLAQCDRNIYESIRETISTIRINSQTKPQKIKCVNCSHEYNQALALNVTDFFG